MGANTVDVTDATFEDDVLGSDKTVLVDFWAAWCGPCKMLGRVLEEIAGEHTADLVVAKVDLDANATTAQRYQVMSAPTMIVFKNGEPVQTIMGAKPKSVILQLLQPHLT